MRVRISNQLPTNLPQLQNLIKRDPESYIDEFTCQHEHFLSLVEVFKLSPTVYNEELDNLSMFIAQVAHVYPDRLQEFPQTLSDILKNNYSVMDPEMRMGLTKALILLRTKNLIPSLPLLELFFLLLRAQDKNLRKFLEDFIVNDIKMSNSKNKNVALNRNLQNYMFSMMKDNHIIAAKISLNVMISLYKKKIWNDPKTVNVIAESCFSKVTKVMVAATQFFLGIDEAKEDKDSSDSEDEETNKNLLKEAAMSARVNKKSRKRKKCLEKYKQGLKKSKKAKKAEVFNFSALHLLHDPQGFTEKLYQKLEKMNERFEVKLMTINLISRLIGIHQIFLLNFYPFVQRFLQPHQREVTKLLLFCAQASHSLVPPECLQSVVKTIANNFVTERNSSEVMAVGLNAIREICCRAPLAMDEDLAQDLVQYKSHKDRAVMMAARSLIQLFRLTNPVLLHKKDRGRPTEASREVEVLEYGQNMAKDYIPGTEKLDLEEKEDKDVEDEEGSDSDSDSSGWEDVSHPSDEEVDDKDVTNEPGDVEKAVAISQNRLLTQEEFEKLEVIRVAKTMTKATKASSKRHRATENKLAEDILKRGELVKLEEIEMIYKKRKHDKESRLATVRAGQEDRGAHNYRPQKQNPHASKTNKEKRKNKNFMMVKHKLKAKQKSSFRDKQTKFRDALRKMKRKIIR